MSMSACRCSSLHPRPHDHRRAIQVDVVMTAMQQNMASACISGRMEYCNVRRMEYYNANQRDVTMNNCKSAGCYMQQEPVHGDHGATSGVVQWALGTDGSQANPPPARHVALLPIHTHRRIVAEGEWVGCIRRYMADGQGRADGRAGSRKTARASRHARACAREGGRARCGPSAGKRGSHRPLPCPALSCQPCVISHVQSKIRSPVANRFQTTVPTRYRATATAQTSDQLPTASR